MKDKQIMVRMPAEMHERLKQVAEDEERTVAQQVRHCVRLFLAEHNEED